MIAKWSGDGLYAIYACTLPRTKQILEEDARQILEEDTAMPLAAVMSPFLPSPRPHPPPNLRR